MRCGARFAGIRLTPLRQWKLTSFVSRLSKWRLRRFWTCVTPMRKLWTRVTSIRLWKRRMQRRRWGLVRGRMAIQRRRKPKRRITQRMRSPKRQRTLSPKRQRTRSPKRQRTLSPKRQRTRSPKRQRTRSPKRQRSPGNRLHSCLRCRPRLSRTLPRRLVASLDGSLLLLWLPLL